MNEILFFSSLIITLLGTIFVFKVWGKVGLFGWIAFANIIMNIEVLKCIDLFGMSVTLGNVLYGSIFLATDVLHDNYGGKEARKAVWLGFYAIIVYLVVTQIGLLFIPNEQDFISPALKEIFGFAPRVCFASLAAYLTSNLIDTYIFGWIKSKSDKLWLRNNSTIISQLIDSALFTVIAFAGLMDWGTIVELTLTTYAIKVIIALIDTPFMYWADKIRRNK